MDKTRRTLTSSGALSAQREAASTDMVLESLRVLRREEIAREQSLVLLAVQWAVLNARPRPRGEAGDDLDALWADLARGGAPHVDHLTIPLFATASGQTEFQAVRLMHEALALVYFLPRVWKRVSEGQIEVWRARKLAADCHDLTREALEYVDYEMSRTTARHTQGGRGGVIKQAKLKHMREQAREQEEQDGKRRQVIFDFTNANNGTVDVFATLDVLDARALMAAVNAHASYLGQESPAERDVREAWALGDIARMALADAPEGSPAKQVNLDFYLHLNQGALLNLPGGKVRVEGDGLPQGIMLSGDVVQSWFARPWGGSGPRITFRPVIDLDDHQGV